MSKYCNITLHIQIYYHFSLRQTAPLTGSKFFDIVLQSCQNNRIVINVFGKNLILIYNFLQFFNFSVSSHLTHSFNCHSILLIDLIFKILHFLFDIIFVINLNDSFFEFFLKFHLFFFDFAFDVVIVPL